ncbi:MAG TPA: hypothetical protein VJA22_03260, partial [Patescibacteria group bacterium]|nr:hypothetical protein [Patescibacteria group bacterium]
LASAKSDLDALKTTRATLEQERNTQDQRLTILHERLAAQQTEIASFHEKSQKQVLGKEQEIDRLKKQLEALLAQREAEQGTHDHQIEERARALTLEAERKIRKETSDLLESQRQAHAQELAKYETDQSVKIGKLIHSLGARVGEVCNILETLNTTENLFLTPEQSREVLSRINYAQRQLAIHAQAITGVIEMEREPANSHGEQLLIGT